MPVPTGELHRCNETVSQPSPGAIAVASSSHTPSERTRDTVPAAPLPQRR